MQHERQSGNEFDFIDWVREQVGSLPKDVDVGPGDDCAVVRQGDEQLLLKVDSVLEGTHFQLDDPEALGYATPRDIGYKVMARTISDIAAMGGVPRFALVASALPKTQGLSLREDLFAGLQAAAHKFDVAIIGGDTKTWSEDKHLALSVSMLGEMGGRDPVLRSGAQTGDVLFVTGELGGSILGKHLNFTPRIEEGRWLAEFGAHAMIDLSDGLSGDLWHICRMSDKAATIDAKKIPISDAAHELSKHDGTSPLDHALHDGEDFELLFAVSAEKASQLEQTWPFETRLSRIGEIEEGKPATALIDGSTRTPLAIKGFEHEF